MSDDETIVDLEPETLDEESLFLEDDTELDAEELGEKDELDAKLGADEE